MALREVLFAFGSSGPSRRSCLNPARDISNIHINVFLMKNIESSKNTLCSWRLVSEELVKLSGPPSLSPTVIVSTGLPVSSRSKEQGAVFTCPPQWREADFLFFCVSLTGLVAQ